MNRGLRNELVTLCGLGALGLLAFRRPRTAMSLGLAAGALVGLGDFRQLKSFRNKNVIITGGSRGLGLALAKELVREGARVQLIARDTEELRRAEQILRTVDINAQVLLQTCDVTDKKQLAQAFQKAVDSWGRVDMLVNNAGAILVSPFDSLDIADFEAQMQLHLYAVIHAVQLILPHFRKRRGGRIVNICSMGGKVAVPHMLTYDTSKFALAGFSQGIGAELKRENIQVTTIYPTLMRTGSPIQAVFKGDHEKEYLWFATGDNMPGLSMKAKQAALLILKSVKEERTEVILSGLGRMRMHMGMLFPETMAWVMALANRFLPRGQSLTYRTGAESSKTFRSYAGNTFLQHGATEAEEQFNQEPKGDAKYNMGLLH